MRTKNTVNRCRPGFGASCSFCCGSHNYVLSENEIEEIFIKRGNGSKALKGQSPAKISHNSPQKNLQDELLFDEN